MADYVLGMEGKLYYRSAGSWVTPTLTIIDNAKDVDLKIERDEADVTTRGNNGFAATVATLRKAEITFNAVWQPGTTLNDLLVQSVMNSESVELWALDGPYNAEGTTGLRAVCQLFGFSRSEKLTEAMEIPVTAKPTISTTPPVWYKVVSALPTTDLTKWRRFILRLTTDNKYYQLNTGETAFIEVA